MPDAARAPFSDQFLAAADAVVRERPDVDPDLAREVFLEAATLLHNGLVLDDLGERDTAVVVAGLCAALGAEDPGLAIRARSATALTADELDDPEAASTAYLVAASLFGL